MASFFVGRGWGNGGKRGHFYREIVIGKIGDNTLSTGPMNLSLMRQSSRFIAS